MEVNESVILVAEDEALIRNLLRLMLSREGYTVLTANDAQEALEICEKFTDSIHLLLMDPVMHRDGVDLTEKIREKRPETKVMKMSGDTLTEIPDTPDAFLKKPFKAPTLLRCVQHVLTSSFQGLCNESDLRERLKDSSPPTS